MYLLEVDVEERTRLALPTTLAPRYCPPSHTTPEASTISEIGHTNSSPPLSLRLQVFSKSQIVSLDSPSHAHVNGKKTACRRSVQFRREHFKSVHFEMTHFERVHLI